MIRNFSSSFLIFSFVQMVSAQAPFSKWIVQSGDSVNTYALGHMDLVHLANNDLLQCTSRDAVGSLDKCRFVRLSPDGDPLQQWEVHAPYMDINKVIELADGSFACFGRINYSALYLHLASDGTPLLAKAYDVTGIGIIAPWRWNDAVQDDSSHFTLAGEWGGFVSTGMIARIQLDGTLDAYDLVHMGADPTFFQSVVRLSNGDHVFHGASNMPNYHSKTYLFRTDDELNPQWAQAYPDSGYIYTFSKLLVLPGDQFRMVLRNSDSSFVGSTLMIATTNSGGVLWARRRIPQPDYPNMIVWPKGALLVGNNIVVVGYASGHDPFVEVLNTIGGELLFGEMHMPSPLVTCANDANSFYVSGSGHGPLGNSALSIGITKLDLDLALCNTVYHSTGYSTWIPSSDPAWSSTTANVSVTDVLAQFTSYPTAAYSQSICISTAIATPHAQEFTIMPNPASDVVIVTGSGIQHLHLLDATGRLILSRSFTPSSSASVDVRDLSPGLYHLRVLTSAGWRTEKLIKE